MSQEQAKYLCDAARQSIDAAIGQGCSLAFPTASATLAIAAGYLTGASNELGGSSDLDALSKEVGDKGGEILGIMLIPWPFVYAALGPWSNGLNNIKSHIPDIAILQPAVALSSRAPAAGNRAVASPMPGAPFVPTIPGLMGAASVPRSPVALHVGKGPKGYTRSDERIREDVCDALTIDPLIDASEVEVSVNGGKVLLQGQVEDRQAKRRTEDISLAVRGVVDVENDLKLR
jgi:hypothetical protein